MDDVYAFLHNDTRNVAEWGPHAHSRSPLPPHVGPLTAELTEDDSLGGESEHSPALPRSLTATAHKLRVRKSENMYPIFSCVLECPQ